VAALLRECRERSIEVLAYSPLAFGLLTTPPGQTPRADTRLRRRLFEQLLPASFGLRTGLDAIARDRGVSMGQVALNWCRSHGTTPIPGLRSPDQARDVAAALTWTLSKEEQTTLDDLRERCRRRMPSNPFQSS